MSFILEIDEKKECVEYMVLKKTARSLVVEEKGTLASSLKEGDVELFRQEMFSLKEKFRFTEARVNLPFRYFQTPVLELPVTRKQDIESALPFELEEHLPLPVDEYVYDHKIIEKTGGAVRVLTLCIGKKYVTGLIERFAEAGIEVSSIRCGVMERLSSAIAIKGQSSFILIDSDQTDTTLVVVKEGKFISARHFARVEAMSSELSTQRDKHGIENIFLTGEPSAEVREITGTPGETQVTPGKKKLRKGLFDLEVYSLKSREWSIAEKKKLVVLILVLSVLFSVSGFFWPVYKDYDALRKVDRQIDKIKEEATGLFEMREGLEAKKEQLKFIEEIMATRDIPLVVLSELSSSLPDNVWLIGFSIDEKGFVELKGFAEDTAKLVEMLERSEMFRSVGFSSPLLTSGDKVRFSVRMELER